MLYAITFLILFLILITSPVTVKICFKKRSSDEFLDIQTVYFGFIKFNLKIPRFLLKINDLVPVILFNIETKAGTETISKGRMVSYFSDNKFMSYVSLLKLLPKVIKKFHRYYGILLKSIRPSKLEFICGYGYEDSAVNAIIAGTIYSLIYILLSLFSRYIDLGKTQIHIDVKPNYMSFEPLDISIHGIIKVRVGHIIIACLYFIVLWFATGKKTNKRVKGARFHGRTSY